MLFFAIPATLSRASFARALTIALVALAVASAPAVGVAWPEARPGDAAEPGAVAGVVPLAADPGHRMGGASAGGTTTHAAGSVPTRATGSPDTRPVGTAARAPSAQHGWLRSLLIGARQQTDGG